MTPDDVINEVRENAGEWLEMTKDPAAFVAGILAKKIIKLQDHIKYLEKRLSYEQKENINT